MKNDGWCPPWSASWPIILATPCWQHSCTTVCSHSSQFIPPLPLHRPSHCILSTGCSLPFIITIIIVAATCHLRRLTKPQAPMCYHYCHNCPTPPCIPRVLQTNGIKPYQTPSELSNGASVPRFVQSSARCLTPQVVVALLGHPTARLLLPPINHPFTVRLFRSPNSLTNNNHSPSLSHSCCSVTILTPPLIVDHISSPLFSTIVPHTLSNT